MKHPVDTSQWGEFVVGELFDCDTTKTFYPNKSELPPGNTPYITRSTYDNGISGYYDDINNEFTIEGNCLTIGAEGGIAFWQPKPFVAGVKVYTVRHPQLNESTALFVASLLNTNSTNYNYTNARVLAKIQAETIKLPLKPSADPSNYDSTDIDWDYMDTVMSRVTEKAKERLASLPAHEQRSKTPVDTSSWGEFVVGELFDVKLSDGDNKPKELPKGNIPLISTGSTNNGVAGTFESDTIIFPADSFTINMFGQAFYQPKPFQTVSHGHVNILIPNFKNNQNIGLFIVTALNAQCQTYSFAEMLTSKKVQAESIKLPLKPSADPSNYTQDDIDWDYMDRFMQTIEENAHARVASLKKQI